VIRDHNDQNFGSQRLSRAAHRTDSRARHIARLVRLYAHDACKSACARPLPQLYVERNLDIGRHKLSASRHWNHDDFLFEEEMTKRDDERLELAKRIAKHEAPGMHRKVDQKLLAKTADRLLRVSSDVLRDMKCDPRIN
jgi:hypothetical protein